jgi:hypothetical protein
MKDDASVSVGVNLNTGKADKELQRLEQKVLKLQEDLTVGKSKKGALTAELEQAQKALAELQAQTKIEGGKAIISPENVTKISAMQEKITSVQAAIEKQNQSLKNTQMELDGVKLRYGEVSQKEQELAAAERGGAEDTAKGKLASVLQSFTGSADVPKLQNVLSGLAAGFKEIASAALSAGKTVTKGFLSAAGSGLKKLVSLAGRAGKAFLNLFKTAGKTNGAFGGGIKNMLRYALGLRGLYALFGKLRAAMTEGFKNLAQFSSGTNKSLSNLKSSLTQLKNALATAFAPILQTIEPILTRFINMLSKAADYIARFTAALTGKSSYTRATKVQEDYAKSIEGTGAAAEDASKSMAKFDEINQITTKDTPSGGGGSSETSPADMFETVAIEPLDFASWGEAFSAMLDKILTDGIPKLKEGLSKFADWVNSFSANLYEMFTFPGVYDKIVLLGAEIANALNGLVSQINWAQLGAALGAGLNLALGFLVSIVYTFDWLSLGAKLADMFNNAVAQIDWHNVGMLLWAKFKIAIETLAGFLLNVDMTQLAHAASELIIGFFDSASETIQSIDWQALGHQIADFLANIDWNGVMDSMFEAIGSALGGLAAFLWGLIEDAWNDVVDWWHEVAYEDGKFTIKGLLNGIWEALKNIWQWIKEHIFQPFIDGFKKAFGIASPSKVMAEQGGFVIDGLLNGIKKGIQPIIDLFAKLKEKIENILKKISEFVSNVFAGDWKDAWSGITDIFKDAWNGIIGFLEDAVNLIIDGINWMISKLNTFSITTPEWLNKLSVTKGLGGKTFGFNIPTLASVQLPRLASGAVIPPNREFMAVLGDQKSGTNIETPLSTMVQAFKQAMNETGGAGGRQMTVILQLDRRELGRAVYQLNNEETQRVGVRLAGAKA